jgi:hypothetical protein
VGQVLTSGATLLAKASEIPDHPWLADDGPPFIISCGRLVVQ